MDIVEQLRKQNLGGIFSDDYVSYAEAADEIERLRQLVELLEGYLNGALNLVENFTHCDTTDARKALGEKD
jgi:hypothetical protein